jgi:hypothetical protein
VELQVGIPELVEMQLVGQIGAPCPEECSMVKLGQQVLVGLL